MVNLCAALRQIFWSTTILWASVRQRIIDNYHLIQWHIELHIELLFWFCCKSLRCAARDWNENLGCALAILSTLDSSASNSLLAVWNGLKWWDITFKTYLYKILWPENKSMPYETWPHSSSVMLSHPQLSVVPRQLSCSKSAPFSLAKENTGDQGERN